MRPALLCWREKPNGYRPRASGARESDGVSEGIGLVAEGFPWREGDNVVLPACEFPSNRFAWQNLASRGVEARLVPCADGRLDLAALADACDGRTRLIAVSWVDYLAGWRNDPAYPYYALGAILAVVAFMVAVIVGGNRAMLREIPSAQRRHHRTVWTTHLAACFLVAFVVAWAVPHQRPDDLLVILPLWVILAGTTMLAQASVNGMMYPAGVVFLITAVVMTFNLSLAPLEAGCLMTGNLVFQGLWLRHQAERVPKVTAR